MAFSGALLLTDLNDFITPSQACIKPVETKVAPVPDRAAAASTEITVDGNGSYYEVGLAESDAPKTNGVKLEKAQISLNDCLACSGCITSAESVLITMQSHEEVLQTLRENAPKEDRGHRVPVLSISPQSLASLAATVNSRQRAVLEADSSKSASGVNGMEHRVTSIDILHRIEAFATQQLGFEYVFDTSFARHVALKEHLSEFQERSATAVSISTSTPLPMIASACPGWVCYAEKTHSEMLPFISTTKSPQQIMGTLVKEWIGKRLGKRSADPRSVGLSHFLIYRTAPDQMYHVAVMPCYDKKLEASRQDFYNEQYRTRDVDCVITTGELELLLSMKGWDLSTPSPALSESSSSNNRFGIPRLFPHAGSSSGGWLQNIIEAVQEKERASGSETVLHTKIIRTADYEETLIESRPASGNDPMKEAKIVFRGAKCYGFRNLQNVVRKVNKESGTSSVSGKAPSGRVTGAAAALRARRAAKAAASTAPDAFASTSSVTEASGSDRSYDYVEVMACPAGCVNGGGQARRPTTAEYGDPLMVEVNGDTSGMGSRWGDREWVKVVEETYWYRDAAGEESACAAQSDSLAESILEELCAGLGEGEKKTRRKELLRTEYRAVVSEVIGLNVKW